MADSTTTNYGWTKPQVGSSTDSWGDKLNGDLDQIDGEVFSVSQALSAQVQPNELIVSMLPSGLDAIVQFNAIDGATRRWIIGVSHVVPETGGNTGSNFYIEACADDGSALGTPLQINRATLICSIAKGPVNAYDVAHKGYVDTQVGAYLPLAGGTLTGLLTVPSLTSNGGLSVSGAASFYSNLTVSAAFTANTIHTTGWAQVDGNLTSNGTVQGSYFVSTGDVHANGNLTGGSVNVSGTIAAGGTLNSPEGVYNSGGWNGGHTFLFGWDGSGVRLLLDGGTDSGYLVRSAENSRIHDFYTIGSMAYVRGDQNGAWSITTGSREATGRSDADALALLESLEVQQTQDARCAILPEAVRAVLPEAFVSGDGVEGGFDFVNDAPIVAALVKAVQQLSARVAELERRAA